MWQNGTYLYILSNVTGCHHLLTIHHHTLWLIVYYFTIALSFPCSFVFFECIVPIEQIEWLNNFVVVKFIDWISAAMQIVAMTNSMRMARQKLSLLFPWKYTDATTFFHAAQCFFGIHHIGPNFIHILLDSLQLL